MQKSTRILLSVGLLLSLGCKPSSGVKSPEDYLPYISMGLEAGATAALLGKNEAKAQSAFAACVTTGVLSSAFNTASDVVIGISTENPQIPAVDVDVSDCVEFAPHPVTEGKEIGDDVQEIIDLWAAAALTNAKFYILKLKGQNCKGYETGMAVLGYVEGLVEPIVAEISEPDGKLSLPAVPVNLAACGE